MSPNKRTGRKRDYVGVLSSVFAIVIGLLVGFVILLICNPSQALPGFVTILTGAFTHGLKGVGQVFYYATPIILTGLSVGFAFKTCLLYTSYTAPMRYSTGFTMCLTPFI